MSIHAEAALLEHSTAGFQRPWQPHGLGEIRYSLPVWGTYLVAEYLYLQDGLRELPPAASDGSPVFDRGSSYRHNLAFTASQSSFFSRVSPALDRLSASLTWLLNPADLGSLLRARISTSYVDNCQIGIEGSFYLGRKGTEFGSLRAGGQGTIGSLSLIVEVGC